MDCQHNSNSTNDFRPDSVAFCLPIPNENDQCDPDTKFTCPCANNLSCVGPSNGNHNPNPILHPSNDPLKLEKDYANCLCSNYFMPSECQYRSRKKKASIEHQKHHPQCQRIQTDRPPNLSLLTFNPTVAPINTPNVAPINTPHPAISPHARSTTTIESSTLQCLGDRDCQPGECCVQIKCNGLRQRPGVDMVSFCSKAPREGDPCHHGSTSTTLSCPCGQTLTCSGSETTEYGYYREQYFKCQCSYPNNQKKCDKFKKDMDKHRSHPGSICRQIPRAHLNLV